MRVSIVWNEVLKGNTALSHSLASCKSHHAKSCNTKQRILKKCRVKTGSYKTVAHCAIQQLFAEGIEVWIACFFYLDYLEILYKNWSWTVCHLKMIIYKAFFGHLRRPQHRIRNRNCNARLIYLSITFMTTTDQPTKYNNSKNKHIFFVYQHDISCARQEDVDAFQFHLFRSIAWRRKTKPNIEKKL